MDGGRWFGLHLHHCSGRPKAGAKMAKKKCKLRKIKEWDTELVFDDNEQVFDGDEPVVDTDLSTLREYEEIVLPAIQIEGRWNIKDGCFKLLRDIDSDVKREGIPYAREFDVRRSFTRAYVNGAEWKLAIGLTPRKVANFDPGMMYGSADDIDQLLKETSYDNSFLTQNTYPIKTEISMDVNNIDQIKTTETDSYAVVATIKGVIIDAASIVVGGPSDIILSGPIDFVGEEVKFSLSKTSLSG